MHTRIKQVLESCGGGAVGELAATNFRGSAADDSGHERPAEEAAGRLGDHRRHEGGESARGEACEELAAA